MKMKCYSVILCVSIVLTLVSGCSSSSDDAVFDYGKVTASVYSNDYFGFSMNAPKGWNLRKMDSKKETNPQEADLFQAFVFPVDSNFIDNANLFITSEKKSNDPLMNDGADYLEDLKKGMEMIAVATDSIGNVKATKLGGKSVFSLEMVNYDAENELETHQVFYATLVKNYWLLVVSTYYYPEQKAVIDASLKGVLWKE